MKEKAPENKKYGIFFSAYEKGGKERKSFYICIAN